MDKRVSRSSTGVMILPQFGSSGTPDINYQVTGTIAGLTLHTTMDELYLALKEALAFQMKLAYEHAACVGVMNRMKKKARYSKRNTPHIKDCMKKCI